MMFSSHAISQLSSQEFKDRMESGNNDDVIVLDVRTEEEYEQAHIKDAILINIHQPNFQSKIDALDRAPTYLIYCRSGHRSAFACQMMQNMGFDEVHNLQNGIIEWVSNYEVQQPNKSTGS